MGLDILTASTSLLVPSTDLQEHVRGSTDDLAMLQVYSRAAQEYAEGFTRRSVYLQRFRLTLSTFPGTGEIELPRSPGSTHAFSSTGVAVKISYLESGNSTWTTFGSTSWRLDTDQEPPKVSLKYGQSWPSATFESGSPIRVDFHAGYYSTSTTAVKPVPGTIKQAICLMGGHWYENREDVVLGTVATQVPRAADSLLWLERV